ncbi:hypothetical protein K5X82_17495 [Halosquirtibacter xylanolyticus]|uniref:hypothetical protein n=1 Tax=Halosquirtibacter xylanolyticus TaxID=3374599 RepID=UPI003747BBD2|nr:hypothetical protein K5X82_17495 [Prolixibacteraceae bacterium]
MKVRKLLMTIALLWGGISTAQDNFKIPFDRITLKLDGRIDYQNTDGKLNGEDINTQGFQTSKMVFQTDIDLYKGLHFFYRQQFKRYNDAPTDGLGKQIEKLGISYERNVWKITVGKQWFNIGSYEQYYDPNDVYTYSGANCIAPAWKTGINIAYNVNNQQIGFQVVNGSEVKGQNDLYYNIYWYGNIGNGFIIPMMNVATDMESGNMGYISEIGARWNFGSIKLDTDFIYISDLKGTSASNDDTYYSIPIQLKYEGKHFQPGVKYIYNNRDDNGVSNITKKSEYHQDVEGYTIEGFLNYYPFEGKDFNIHAVATYDKLETIDTRPNEPKDLSSLRLMVGIRFGFDIFGKKN